MYLELDGEGALYSQLTRALERSILHGHLPAGARLPATRALAEQLELSRHTVVTAYETLCAQRLAVSKVGAGTFVAAAIGPRSVATVHLHAPAQSRFAARLRRLPPLALRRRDPLLRYDLQVGEPLVDPPLLTAWRRQLARAATRHDFQYPPFAGVLALRQAIAEYLGRHRGVVCDAADVVVVSGAQQAVSLLARVLLDEADTVAIEDPGYQLAVHALLAHGARLLPVRTDAEGLLVAALPRGGVRMIHVTPSHQFPTGAVMSLQRRRALLRYAAERRCWVVEDDYDGEFRYDGVAIPALRSLDESGRVIYVGSFSKVLFPGLRLGYVVCPPGLRDDLIAAKSLDDFGCGSIEQEALAELMRSGAFDRHLRRAALELRRRRAALLDGLRRHCHRHITANDSGAGMHLVGWLRDWSAPQLQALVALSMERGLGLHPIAPHYRGQPAPAGLLLGYAALSEKQLRAATALLGECLDEVIAQED